MGRISFRRLVCSLHLDNVCFVSGLFSNPLSSTSLIGNGADAQVLLQSVLITNVNKKKQWNYTDVKPLQDSDTITQLTQHWVGRWGGGFLSCIMYHNIPAYLKFKNPNPAKQCITDFSM